MVQWTDAELKRLYKLQARQIARALIRLTNVDDLVNADRYSGQALCPICQLEYYEHPCIVEGPAAGLTVTCTGRLIKL
jgi:hypothetical protein